MQGAIAGVVAALVGMLLGFWLRGRQANAEKEQNERRRLDFATQLEAMRVALTQALAESATRAGYQPLAEERGRSLAQLATEREGLREALQASQLAERSQTARVSQLEADLANATQNLTKQTARHESEVQQLQAERRESAAKSESDRVALAEELRAKIIAEREQAARISQLEAQLKAERESLAEKLALLETAKQSLANQFQALAAEILEQKSKSFSEGSQKELGTLLQPLKEQIRDFREKVEKAQSDSSNGVTRLETLVGTLNNLNQQLSQEAHNLTTALRGSNKAQGDWGEFILRDLLEKAGLREGEQFSFQQSFTGVETAEGEKARTQRTDVIVTLPGGRHLVIDSKVSLKAYTDSVNAESEELRAAALKEHLKSVRGHVTGLSAAGYHRLPGIAAPDFVVMFVPVEPAFLTALQSDTALWSDAYKQGILLVGPTTLLYVIRIVSVLWQQEAQVQNVQDVMDRGAALYDKFVGFVGDLEKMGKNLRDADDNYGKAMKKLSEGPGNLVRQVQMLKDLGVRTTKMLPKSLLDAAGVEEETLELAAETETEAAL